MSFLIALLLQITILFSGIIFKLLNFQNIKIKGMDQERLSFLALHLISGVGDYSIKQLISYCGSASEVFKKPKGKLLRVPGIGEVTATAIKSENTFAIAEREFRKAEKEGVDILIFTDKKYPARLKSIDDAPTLLYAKGNVNLNHPKTVGIVGTRQATVYGKENVEKIVEALIPHKVLIISGLAYGIDIHAHKHSIKNGLPTLGVMGSGIDIIYPAGHKETAKKMLDHGGLLTENHFGAKPDAHNFPARNRIIAGLCDALIVAEAAEKGGALITAEIANSYNKDVFALPGNIGQTFSEGCNKLIKTNKAHLLNSVKDLEYIMNWSADDNDSKVTKSLFSIQEFEPDEQKLLLLMKEKNLPVMIDDLAWQSGLTQGALASLLLTLEMKNAVQALPGKMFKLIIK